MTASHFFLSHSSCDSACATSDEGCAYQVAWTINPHMIPGAVDSAAAAMEHRALVRALERCGAKVTVLPFVHGAYDCVFSKDNAIVVQRETGAIEGLLARPRFAERRAEQDQRRAQLEAAGVHFRHRCDHPLEGGDVVVLPGGRDAFVGHGFRSSERSREALAEFLGGHVTGIALRDERLYHLDMALSLLEDGTALVCEDAIGREGMLAVVAHPAVRSVIRIPLEEALAFGANLVQVGRDILAAGEAPRTQAALRERGYRVHRVSLDQFHLAGGSAACLVSRVHAQKRRRAALETAA